MEAGIVVYMRNAGSLIGKWAHEKTGGILSREIVHDVAEGVWEGHWPVDIFAGEDLFFQGTLRSVKLGNCLKLTWRGKFKDGSLHTYEGIGYVIDATTAAASFEEIPKADRANPFR